MTRNQNGAYSQRSSYPRQHASAAAGAAQSGTSKSVAQELPSDEPRAAQAGPSAASSSASRESTISAPRPTRPPTFIYVPVQMGPSTQVSLRIRNQDTTDLPAHRDRSKRPIKRADPQGAECEANPSTKLESDPNGRVKKTSGTSPAHASTTGGSGVGPARKKSARMRSTKELESTKPSEQTGRAEGSPSGDAALGSRLPPMLEDHSIRAEVLALLSDGKLFTEVQQATKVSKRTLIQWGHAGNAAGILQPMAKKGRPRANAYNNEKRAKVFILVSKNETIPAISKETGVSESIINSGKRRVLPLCCKILK
jgi:transposase